MMKFLILFLIFSSSFSSIAQTSKQAVKAQEQNDQEASASQENISSLASQTRRMLSEYQKVLKDIENARIYNNHMRQLILSQKEEKISIREQIQEVKHTDKQIVPLMIEMVEALEKFIELDIPFLKKERLERLEEIKKLMKRADITTAEKYRRIMEAYQIENEYGRTIGVYKDSQKIKDRDLTVEILRVGRLSLIYQTLDGNRQAYWSAKDQKWIQISGRYERIVSLGFKIAKKQVAPNLVIGWLLPATKTKPFMLEDSPASLNRMKLAGLKDSSGEEEKTKMNKDTESKDSNTNENSSPLDEKTNSQGDLKK